ncbi:MAG: GtrA family protein [Novosphingobium sp.]
MMAKTASPAELRRFARFLGVGALNTLFGYALFAMFVLLGLASGLALALATVIGVAFNFLTTGKLVFGNSGHAALPRYLGVYAGQFLINWAALHLLEQTMPTLAAQLILVGPMAVLTYLALARFVFGETPGGRP